MILRENLFEINVDCAIWKDHSCRMKFTWEPEDIKAGRKVCYNKKKSVIAWKCADDDSVHQLYYLCSFETDGMIVGPYVIEELSRVLNEQPYTPESV